MTQKPTQYRATVSELQMLNTKVMLIKLELESPTEIFFKPGQFISVKVSEKNYRSYSISSSSRITKSLEIIAAVGHDGVGANFFRNLQIGNEVLFIGPSGSFHLHLDAEEYIFIATGTGISPLLSMLDLLKEQQYPNSVLLLFGIRDESELMLMNKINEYARASMNFDYKICFSQQLAQIPNAVLGRVTNYIPIHKTAHYYLCGNPNMVVESIKLLRDAGITENQIHHEKFTTATSST